MKLFANGLRYVVVAITLASVALVGPACGGKAEETPEEKAETEANAKANMAKAYGGGVPKAGGESTE
jgi:hypothetical protein